MEFPSPSKRMRFEREESPSMQKNGGESEEKIIKAELDDEQNEIKLELVVENVKEEPLDDEYFEMAVPKLEPETATTSIVADNGNFPQIYTKYKSLEAIKEQSKYNHRLQMNYETATTSFNSKYKNSRTNKNLEISNIIQRNNEWCRRCQLCDNVEDASEMKLITTEATKLVILPIFFEDAVHNAQAMQFLNSGKRCLVCLSHLPEIVAKVQEHCREPILSKNLMPIVNFFRPNVTPAQFRYQSSQFVTQNSSLVNVRGAEKEQSIDSKNEKASINSDVAMDCCELCTKLVDRRHLKLVTLEEERLVFAVFFNKFPNPNHAMNFMNGSLYAHVCCTHYPELVEKVRGYPRCEDDIDELMKTVHLFRPNLENNQFLSVMIRFVQKNHSSVWTESRQLLAGSRFCAVCDQLTATRDFSFVTSAAVKMAIMVGCILRGTHTIDYAKMFIETKKIMAICHTHYTKSIDQIYAALEIEDHRNMLSCSRELMDNFMKLVNVFCPNMWPPQFHTIVVSMTEHVSRVKERADINST